MTPANLTTTTLRYIVSLAVLVLSWAAAVHILQIPPYLLPDPVSVLATLIAEWPGFYAAARLTFGNTAVGALIGISLGVALGGLAAYSRRVRWLFEPYLGLFQSFPRESLLPLLIVWLGFGAGPKIISSGLLAFFPMAVITLSSLSDTREDYLRLFESWNASRLQTFLFGRLPAATPALIGGLKVCLPLALIGAVLGEFLGGNGGLGYLIMSSGSAFRTDRLFAAIVVLAAGGLIMTGMVDAIRLILLRRFFQR